MQHPSVDVSTRQTEDSGWALWLPRKATHQQGLSRSRSIPMILVAWTDILWRETFWSIFAYKIDGSLWTSMASLLGCFPGCFPFQEIQVVWDIHMVANPATNTNLSGRDPSECTTKTCHGWIILHHLNHMWYVMSFNAFDLNKIFHSCTRPNDSCKHAATCSFCHGKELCSPHSTIHVAIYVFRGGCIGLDSCESHRIATNSTEWFVSLFRCVPFAMITWWWGWRVWNWQVIVPLSVASALGSFIYCRGFNCSMPVDAMHLFKSLCRALLLLPIFVSQSLSYQWCRDCIWWPDCGVDLCLCKWVFFLKFVLECFWWFALSIMFLCALFMMGWIVFGQGIELTGVRCISGQISVCTGTCFILFPAFKLAYQTCLFIRWCI